MVAGGVQYGWALQLSLLTPYVQVYTCTHTLIDHPLSVNSWPAIPLVCTCMRACYEIIICSRAPRRACTYTCSTRMEYYGVVHRLQRLIARNRTHTPVARLLN
jgi:hypothetical protein